MGFALWVRDGIARAEGTHEYRPMGIAIISKTDLFRASDFRPRLSQVEPSDRDFAGYFASIHHLNHFLKGKRNDSKAAIAHHHGGVLSNS
jgi:hypothetical protein